MFSEATNTGIPLMVDLLNVGLLVFGVLLIVIMIGIIKKLFKKKV